MNMNTSRWLTYEEAMNELHIKSKNTLYNMIRDGLPVIKIGRLRRIDIIELDKYLKMNEKR